MLFGGWIAWFFAAEVIVYETARIEVDRAAHTVDAPVAGRVKTSALELGREVEAGQVVVEIDAELEQRRLAEERARLATLGPQIDALRRQLVAEEQVLRDARRASDSAIEEGRARRTVGAVHQLALIHAGGHVRARSLPSCRSSSDRTEGGGTDKSFARTGACSEALRSFRSALNPMSPRQQRGEPDRGTVSATSQRRGGTRS
ncbi:hypothetical protein A7982_13593 [Minicystis rosea]|nr:hypothetical protein A7982_13593 [Minicystis rosea]